MIHHTIQCVHDPDDEDSEGDNADNAGNEGDSADNADNEDDSVDNADRSGDVDCKGDDKVMAVVDNCYIVVLNIVDLHSYSRVVINLNFPVGNFEIAMQYLP